MPVSQPNLGSIVAASGAFGPLVALPQHGDAEGGTCLARALASLAMDATHLGAIVAADAIGPVVLTAAAR